MVEGVWHLTAGMTWDDKMIATSSQIHKNSPYYYASMLLHLLRNEKHLLIKKLRNYFAHTGPPQPSFPAFFYLAFDYSIASLHPPFLGCSTSGSHPKIVSMLPF